MSTHPFVAWYGSGEPFAEPEEEPWKREAWNAALEAAIAHCVGGDVSESQLRALMVPLGDISVSAHARELPVVESMR